MFKSAAGYFAGVVLLLGCAYAQPERLAQDQAGKPPAMRILGTSAWVRNSEDLANKATQARSQSRVALVVGNGAYRRLSPLRNAVNDAQDMCETLRALEFEVICRMDISERSEFRQVVRQFTSKLRQGSVALFYYAGHGVQINGENYLLPVQIDARNAAEVEDDGISLSFLMRTLDEARSVPNIVILDACRNNPFPKPIAGLGSKGLARMDPPNGTMLVYATSPNGVALEGEERNGVFTKHLLSSIVRPGVKLDELFQIVAEGVEREAKAKYQFDQNPFRTSSFSGVFCVAGCEDPQVAEQIESLRKMSEEAATRARELAEENVRLRKQFEDRATYVRDLEVRIERLAASPDSQRPASESGTREEIEKLRASLEAARREQGTLERRRIDIAERDKEVATLKAQVAEFATKAKELEEYRQQVQSLKQESAEKSRLLQNQGVGQGGSKQLVIPSF